MKLLITAGGTIEKIDEVRSIANHSTGRLGLVIAKCFLAYPYIEKIFYVCGKSALLPPDNKKIEIWRIEDVSELKNTLQIIFSENSIDGVVHCMAVSDYCVKTVTTSEKITEDFSKQIKELDQSAPDFEQKVSELLKKSIYNTNSFQNTGKISSDLNDLVLILNKTPKIIGMIKQMQPQTVLVGFKLLNNVEPSELIEAGISLMKKNNCDFVFANDLSEVNPDSHSGFFITPDGSFNKITGREQIAQTIAHHLIDKITSKGDAKQ